ncbi:MAG: HigA family addiction module antitoxin [Candidatus Hinthialibacter antarcticus]|nr:HigA family addiction module antitoxin [Candidatus Hinthialibacter antarcticus]
MKTNNIPLEGDFHSNLPIPPGEYLEEVIEDLGMSKSELARRLERPAPKLSAIFKGEKAITPDTALRLQQVVGVPAHIWTGLEAEYRLALARLDEEKQAERLKDEIHFVPRFCYSQLVKLGEVEKKTKPIDKVRELLNFFGTMSLKTISTLQRFQPAYRLGAANDYSSEALAAWIRLGERRAAHVDCKPFEKKTLKAKIEPIRNLTNYQPDEFLPELIDHLASCGVALVVCPHFPKTKAHGATFQLREDKVVLMMTIRYCWADIFWFSLFHELGHILRHSIKDVIIENNIKNTREDEADAFARDMLVPSNAYEAFVKKTRFDLGSIVEFSRQIDVHPGIIVGRLQHERIVKRNWHNELRERYEWKDV